jgi:hypothetical protein
MNQTAVLGWASVSALLVDTASRDLKGIDGAFGVTAAEWSVVCFVSGVATAAIGAAVSILFRKKDPPG